MQLHEWVRDNLPIGDAIRKLKSYSRDSHIPLFHPQILLKFDHFLDDSSIYTLEKVTKLDSEMEVKTITVYVTCAYNDEWWLALGFR